MTFILLISDQPYMRYKWFLFNFPSQYSIVLFSFRYILIQCMALSILWEGQGSRNWCSHWCSHFITWFTSNMSVKPVHQDGGSCMLVLIYIAWHWRVTDYGVITWHMKKVYNRYLDCSWVVYKHLLLIFINIYKCHFIITCIYYIIHIHTSST